MYAIEANDLEKTYPKKITLYNFSIRIPAGEIYGLLGPNGAGKSTFIRILAGLERQDSGELKILGEVPGKKIRKTIGVAPQENSFHNLLTCFENLIYYAELYGMKRNESEKRADELLDMLGLGEKKNVQAAWLSGGMKRRLNLACALMHKPKIIILDEPTTGLDPISRIRMWNVVRSIKEKEKATILLTTHYMEEAETLCDQISFVNRGHIVRTGTPEKLKSIIGKEFLRVKSTPGNYQKIIQNIEKIEGVKHVTVANEELLIEAKNAASKIGAITRMLNENNENIIDLRVSQATLEDAFIKLTGAGLKGAKNETTK
ncbi:ABC transporter ATP-binding protein [Candidatus Micrarchaeota archaeon]|nr:ABC transporter ATP-binding protein [Candidatus Micrarchaeota archaeon]